jgi:hypothetical protein
MADTFETRLLKAYPEATWPTLIRGAREAVKMADAVRRSTPFLSTDVGSDLRGFLRRAAIMWRVQTLCKTGELPFQATEVSNSNRTSHLLSILSENLELHIVRTDDVFAFPEDAPIRQDRRVTNQPDLFDDGKIVPLTEALRDVFMVGSPGARPQREKSRTFASACPNTIATSGSRTSTFCIALDSKRAPPAQPTLCKVPPTRRCF